MLGKQIDGLLLHGLAPGEEAKERLKKIPTVWLMGNRQRPEWGDQVAPDPFAIGELAAQHLIARNHRTLAFMNLDAGHRQLHLYGRAFAATAAESSASISAVEQTRQVVPEYWREHSPAAVESIVEQYLDLDPRPTGIFVADDMQVAMIQPALQRRGVDISPGKVEIISCNHEEPYLVGLIPRPAVIDIRVESIGRRGVEQLLWRLEHTEVPERIITTIEPHVV